MNDQIHSDGSDHEHGALGDAEYAEFMELAAQEGFDVEDVEGAIDEAGHGPLPVLAVVGRPNVGKSTLVNRIIGRREAVVEDKPGVTRDRVTYEAEWAGRRFKVVDTGGWEQDVLGIDASVAAQAEYAIEAADAVVFVVDSTVGATDTDEAVVKLLRRAASPSCCAPTRSTARAARPTPPRSGRSVSANRTRSPRCTAVAPATCSTPSSKHCPRPRPSASAPRSAVRAASRSSAVRTSASPRC